VDLLEPAGRRRPPVEDDITAERGESADLSAGTDGEPWRTDDWNNWRNRRFLPAAAHAGLGRPRPYDLRHAFASLLIREQQTSIVELAEQLGHAPHDDARHLHPRLPRTPALGTRRLDELDQAGADRVGTDQERRAHRLSAPSGPRRRRRLDRDSGDRRISEAQRPLKCESRSRARRAAARAGWFVLICGCFWRPIVSKPDLRNWRAFLPDSGAGAQTIAPYHSARGHRIGLRARFEMT